MKRALLVVDIDHYNGWKPEDVVLDSEKERVAKAIKQTLDDERAKESVVAFVIVDWYDATGQETQIQAAHRCHTEPKDQKGGCIVCDRSDVERLAAFLEHRHEIEAAFIKKYCDAFTNYGLAKYLHSAGIKEIMLAGCYTSICILDTTRGALQNGFHVTLLDNCTYPPFENMPDKKGWIQRAKNAIPPGSSLRVQIV